jgi:hypothetical protein
MDKALGRKCKQVAWILGEIKSDFAQFEKKGDRMHGPLGVTITVNYFSSLQDLSSSSLG